MTMGSEDKKDLGAWYKMVSAENAGYKETLTVTEHPGCFPYLLKNSLREQPVLKELREQIMAEPMAGSSASADEAQFICMLMQIMNAKRIVEVGVFKGYTTLAMALQLPSDGKIVALDVPYEWSPLPEKYWNKGGVRDKIDLRLAAADESMRKLIAAGEAGTYDLIFIDANKDGYPVYYELALELLRPGGLVLVDNTLYHGTLLGDPEKMKVDSRTIHELNQRIHKDERVTIAMLPVADGLTIARKKE
ncbi:putative O-methyltransferase [Planoprotostelium fungivorum]|uniref:Putative O-methyltransferase n=1 Tax=Planoprotostelium fungivorum TaxID=1890364 RepID=A0A2P6NJT9_9EUKA|nr:putative O-methyltransferase [Planoprotostelium fungivorum]